MKIDWNEFQGKTLHVTMQENFGLAYDQNTQAPIYEIVFKTGKLNRVFEEGLLLEQERENLMVRIFIPYTSVKCIEIFDI
jgi:hypothetical protein